MNTVDKSSRVAIHNVNAIELDSAVLAAVMQKMCRYIKEAAPMIDIYPQERQPNGVLEWTVRVNQGVWFTLGVIQRSPGAEVEFHS